MRKWKMTRGELFKSDLNRAFAIVEGEHCQVVERVLVGARAELELAAAFEGDLGLDRGVRGERPMVWNAHVERKADDDVVIVVGLGGARSTFKVKLDGHEYVVGWGRVPRRGANLGTLSKKKGTGSVRGRIKNAGAVSSRVPKR